MLFVLTVDDFGIEYVDKCHTLHLQQSLHKHYTIATDWDRTKFVGVNLDWTYANKHSYSKSHLSMKSYIELFLLKYGHEKSSHSQLTPHKHWNIKYGAKQQPIPDANTRTSLDAAEVKIIQEILGALLYYTRAGNNNLLVALSAIGDQQAAATKSTAGAIKKFLDYVATYTNDGISYHASDMVLASHPDAGFHNESKGRSRAGA